MHITPMIRLGTVSDAEVLADLARRTFVDTYAHLNTPEDTDHYIRTHFDVKQVAAELADPDHVFLLLYAAAQLAGFAQLIRKPVPPAVPAGALNLSRYYLDRPWLGKGLAQPLLEAAKQSAMAQGASHLWLTVWEKNPRAIAYYQKSGFTSAGLIPFTVGQDVQTDHLLVLALS